MLRLAVILHLVDRSRGHEPGPGAIEGALRDFVRALPDDLARRPIVVPIEPTREVQPRHFGRLEHTLDTAEDLHISRR